MAKKLPPPPDEDQLDRRTAVALASVFSAGLVCAVLAYTRPQTLVDLAWVAVPGFLIFMGRC